MITCANDISISDSEVLMAPLGGCPHCHRPLTGNDWIHQDCLEERLLDAQDAMYALLKKISVAAFTDERRAMVREAQAMVQVIERGAR